MADEITIIRDVGNTLKELLEEKIPELKDKISFNSPADMKNSDKTGLSLFLYQVAENIHTRNRSPEPHGPEQLAFPPVILDLHYLLTPYGGREAEFDFMEKVIRIFYDQAILRGSILKRMLLDSGNDELRLVPQYLSLENLNHLWSTFAQPLKLSVAYIVTPVRIPSVRELEARRVVHKEDRYYQIVAGERKK